MDFPSHQFVVLAYRDSPFLSACLESVCAQSSTDNVIVVTSTPSVHIDAIAAAHGVKVYEGTGNRGIAADWNFGLACATGDIVTLAHQDDVYYPGFADETRRMFQATPTASLAFTCCDEIDDHGRRLPRGRVLGFKRVLVLLAAGRNAVIESRLRRRALLAFGNAIPCPSVSLNRSMLADFRFSDGYDINLDWDAWWRLQMMGDAFVHSRRVLMAHRLHPDAETAKSRDDGRRKAEDQRMFRHIWPGPTARILAALYRFAY